MGETHKSFPPKGGIRDIYHTDEFLESRRKDLDKWISAIQKAIRKMESPPDWWREFLCSFELMAAANRGNMGEVKRLIESGLFSVFDTNHHQFVLLLSFSLFFFFTLFHCFYF